jgi:hypothetical protein
MTGSTNQTLPTRDGLELCLTALGLGHMAGSDPVKKEAPTWGASGVRLTRGSEPWVNREPPTERQSSSGSGYGRCGSRRCCQKP